MLQLLDAIFKNPGIYLDVLQTVVQCVCGVNVPLGVICQTIWDLLTKDWRVLCEDQKKKELNLWYRYKAYLQVALFGSMKLEVIAKTVAGRLVMTWGIPPVSF